MVFMPEIVTFPILILPTPYFHSWSVTLHFIFWFGLSFLTTKQGDAVEKTSALDSLDVDLNLSSISF